MKDKLPTPLSTDSTAPVYSVRERSDGALVNDRLGLVWPEKQRKPRKAKKTGMVQEPPSSDSFSTESRQRERRQRKTGKKKSKSKTSPSTPKCAVLDESQAMSEHYWGSMSIQEIGDRLEKGGFALFFPVPEEKNIDSVPFAIKLSMAYRTSAGKLLTFPIDRDTFGQWSVDIRGPEKPTFDTIAQMIRYYTIHAYINPTTSEIETLPIWEGSFEEKNRNNSSKTDTTAYDY